MEIKFTRINDSYELYALVAPLEKVSEQFKEVPTGIARLTIYQSEGVNFYSFGLNTFDNKPGHGGEWSSNSRYINEVFGTDIIECAVRETHSSCSSYTAMACDKSFLKSVTPKTLEFRNGSLYQTIDYPHGDDYFMSTTIDKEGNLLWPTAESMEKAIIKHKRIHCMSEGHDKIQHMRRWIVGLSMLRTVSWLYEPENPLR
jgi:hypothetical protein